MGELFSDFEIITAETDETMPDGVPLREAVAIIAERKGRAVLNSVSKSERGVVDDCLIIASDTMVEAGGYPLGKPKDDSDAYRMLRLLSGRAHNVHTGIAVFYRGSFVRSVASTRVYFKDLSDEQISAYIKTGEPMDKAGAYGIQGEAGMFVEKIEGDFDTVVGLSKDLTRTLVDQIIEKTKLK